jgi:O-antigen/teichoic acid export membrane protein/GT2 family glycosyltransferase
MSLTDKIIKNTYYYAFSQIATLIIPFILTPFIISKIGEAQFGIYAVVLGVTTSFGLFDISISSSFIKFISEYYNKKDYGNLNNTINTGFIFYLLFSVFFCALGYIFKDWLLSLINIPPELHHTAMNVMNIALLLFFVSNAFTIFGSVIISLQKMYITSILATVISVLNFVLVIVLLNSGYGLEGILFSQLITAALSSLVVFYFAKKSLPELTFGFQFFKKDSLNKMGKFGIQMQVSKMASFASDKFDEFLLAAFSTLNNVAFFNIANRLIRVGRLFPFQLVVQVAPVAAELNGRGENEKLQKLFVDTTKYLTFVTIPIYLFIIAFADHIILFWMGVHYDITVHIVRILAVAQIANLILSAPGNSITPNIGVPKYQMYEGVFHLILNIALSYFLIRQYGIIGAAYGNAVSTILSSYYVYHKSCEHFGESKFGLFKDTNYKPLLTGAVTISITYIIVWFAKNNLIYADNRFSGFLFTSLAFVVFAIGYLLFIFKLKFLNMRDKTVIAKMITKIIPVQRLLKSHNYSNTVYSNELVSFCIVTHNRLSMLKQNLKSLLSTIGNINAEILVWDNDSSDGTKEFLSELSLEHQNIKITLHDKNIGCNAKGLNAELSKGDFIIGIDDDVLEFPENWVENFIHAYKQIPLAGYLATDVIKNEYTDGAKSDSYVYFPHSFGDVILQEGPTGGWCFMISRDVYNIVGKFYLNSDRIFFFEDKDYCTRILAKGFRVGIVDGINVLHATGEYYNKEYKKVYTNKITESRIDFPAMYKFRRKILLLINPKNILRKVLQYSNG